MNCQGDLTCCVELVSGNGGPVAESHCSKPESPDHSAPPQPHGGSLISIQPKPSKKKSKRGKREKEEKTTKDKRSHKSTTRRGKEVSVSSSMISGGPSHEGSAVAYTGGSRGCPSVSSPAPLKELVTRGSNHGTYSQYSLPGF